MNGDHGGPMVVFLDPADRRLLNAGPVPNDGMEIELRADLLSRLCEYMATCKEIDRKIIHAFLLPGGHGASVASISRDFCIPKRTVFHRLSVIRKAMHA